MANSKNTKRALLASILSIVLCMAMLVGTTFAWFTDSVTSSDNKIMSGNLKVDLVHIVDGEDISIKDYPNHKIFDYDKWEPGYTAMETLKVVNKGNLALKFRLDIFSNPTVSSTGEKLSDVIDVWVYEGADIPTPASFADIETNSNWRNAGTLSYLMSYPTGAASGVLLPKNATPANDEPVEKVQMTVALHMRESAGNEYQNLSLGDVKFFLTASQYTYENDSFDNQYDANAATVQEQNLLDLIAAGYTPVTNAAEIETAFTNGGKVVLAQNITFDNTLQVAKNTTATVDLNGYTLKGTAPTSGSKALISNKGTLTVSDSIGGGEISYGTEEEVERDWYSKGIYTILNQGTLNITSGTIKATAKVPSTSDGNGKMISAVDNNSTVGDAVLNVTGGLIDGGMHYGIRQFCNSKTYKNVVNISGGIIKGGDEGQGVWLQIPSATSANLGELNITGGTIEGSVVALYVYNIYNTELTEPNVKVSVTGGTIKINDAQRQPFRCWTDFSNNTHLDLTESCFINTAGGFPFGYWGSEGWTGQLHPEY